MRRLLDLGRASSRVELIAEPLAEGDGFTLQTGPDRLEPWEGATSVELSPADALAVACAIVRELDVSRLVDVPAEVLAGLEGLRMVFDDGKEEER